jgi:hypothetical protein
VDEPRGAGGGTVSEVLFLHEEGAQAAQGGIAGDARPDYPASDDYKVERRPRLAKPFRGFFHIMSHINNDTTFNYSGLIFKEVQLNQPIMFIWIPAAGRAYC